MLARCLCASDRCDEARVMLDEAAERDFASVPLDSLWSSTLVTWSDVATQLASQRHASALYELLRPHAELSNPRKTRRTRTSLMRPY